VAAYPLDNVVRCIDLKTRKPRGDAIKGVGKGANDMDFGDGVLWVANTKSNSVTRIDQS